MSAVLLLLPLLVLLLLLVPCHRLLRMTQHVCQAHPLFGPLCSAALLCILKTAVYTATV
jgi:hypothetical protein